MRDVTQEVSESLVQINKLLKSYIPLVADSWSKNWNVLKPALEGHVPSGLL